MFQIEKVTVDVRNQFRSLKPFDDGNYFAKNPSRIVNTLMSLIEFWTLSIYYPI